MAGDPDPGTTDEEMAISPGMLMAGGEPSWAEQAAGDWPFSAQFFLLSAPPGAGKTTFLEQCATAFRAKGLRAGGTIAPDSGPGARRELVLLQTSTEPEHGASDERFQLQLNDPQFGDGSGDSGGDETPDGAVRVGKFVLDDSVLQRARAAFLRLCRQERREADAPVDWVFVDEIGPLELKQGKGLEPAIGELLRSAARGELGPPQPRFIIVVRQSCRDEAVRTYGLDGTGCGSVMEEEGMFAGFGGAAARAAAVVDLTEVPAPGEATDEFIGRLAGLPPLL